jgi:hypothetical protein
MGLFWEWEPFSLYSTMQQDRSIGLSWLARHSPRIWKCEAWSLLVTDPQYHQFHLDMNDCCGA